MHYLIHSVRCARRPSSRARRASPLLLLPALCAAAAVGGCGSDNTGVVVTDPNSVATDEVAATDVAVDSAMLDDVVYDPFFTSAVVHMTTYGDSGPYVALISDAGATPSEACTGANEGDGASDATVDAAAAPADGGTADAYGTAGDASTDAAASGTDAGGAAGGQERRWPLARPLYPLLRDFGAHVSRACVTESGFIDADSDGVPVMYSATFNCVNQKVGNTTVTVMGQAMVNDANDASKTSGYTATFQNLNMKVTQADGSSRARTLNGTVTLAPSNANPPTFTISRDLTIAFNVAPAGTPATTGTFATKTSASYVPDSDTLAAPFAHGTLTGSGAGTLNVFVEGGTVSRTVTRSTDPTLHWNRACSAQNARTLAFDSGAIVYRDNVGDSLRHSFSGCGSGAVRYTAAK